MGAELQAGRAFIDLIPRVSPAGSAAAQAQMGGLFGGLAGKAKVAGLAIGAGLAVGAVAAGVGAFKIGENFDEAFRTIRLGTGATGEALEGLKGSFKNVLGDVPDDLGDVSTAIADLNTRTGLTGPSLETLAVQMLQLARVADADLGDTIRSQTRLFGDWGIAVEDQAGTLDYLWKVSQATGIGVNDLSAKLVQFGGPLRQLGFTMEDSAALLGKFEKEGVNTELVLGSLRIGLGKFARAGEPAKETLGRVVDEIKNAGDASTANAIALETFGARAGPDMAAAIREGRFELDDLTGALEASGETVAGAAKDAERFGEKWDRVKNRLLVAVEPIASGLFDKIGEAMDALGPIIDTLSDAFSALFGGDSEGFAQAMDSLLGGSGEYVDFFRTLGDVIQTVAGFIRDNLKPILIGLGIALALLISPIGTVIAAIVLAYAKFEGFRNVVDAVASFLTEKVVPAVAQFVGYISEQIANLVAWWKEHWEQIRTAVSAALAPIRAGIEAFTKIVSWIWENFGDSILAYIEMIWGNIRVVVEVVIDVIRGIIETVLALISGDWEGAWKAIRDTVGNVLDGIWQLIVNVFNFVRVFIGDAISATAGLITSGLTGARDAAIGILNGLIDFVIGLPGRAAAALSGMWNGLLDGLRAILRGIVNLWNNFHIPGFEIGPWEIPTSPWTTVKVGPFGMSRIDFPNIYLPGLEHGGDVLRRGLALIGENGPEILDLQAGARVTPLDTAALLAQAEAGRGSGQTNHFYGIDRPRTVADELAWLAATGGSGDGSG